MQQNKRIQQYKCKRNFFAYTILTYSLVLAGCVQRTSTPFVVKVQDSTLNEEQSRDIVIANMMEVAEDVLIKMHFTIEKADVRNGIIRTRPLPGAQFFEFWRSDNVGVDNTIAANLHTIRRTVIINITRQNKQIQITCDVQVERLSLPERHLSSSAGVYRIFSRSSPSLQRLQLNPDQAKRMVWIDFDRDTKLGKEIIKQIKTQIVQQTNPWLQRTEKQT